MTQVDVMLTQTGHALIVVNISITLLTFARFLYAFYDFYFIFYLLF